MIDAPSIITDRLFLRPVELGDAVATAALMSPRISANLTSWPNKMTISQAIDRISDSRRHSVAGRWVDWGIFLKDDLHLIGWVGVGRSDEGEAPFKIGYWIGDIFQQQRYGTEAVTAVVTRVNGMFGATALEAHVLLTNEASKRLLAKLGFMEAGRGMCDSPVRGRQEEFVHFRLDPLSLGKPEQEPLRSSSAVSE